MSVDDSARGYRTNCTSCGKSILVPSNPFDEGCIVGDFVLNSKLGAGSIGAVYKATQISLDRPVALKILFPEYITAKGTRDFLREARAAAKLSHTNLVQSYAVGEDNGVYFMAMTYISGETLKSRLRREKKIPVDEALHIVQQVAEALYYAWDESRLIHRDVKPDNIMITEDGIVKLTDLGLAINQSEWREGMEISGSPSYMSPEQFCGEKLDTRSDIYSLGVTLYQMLSGRLPFCAETIKSVARQHFEENAEALHHLDPNIPPKVDALVHKMMAKHPDDRFQDMEALLNEIWMIRQKTAPNKSLIPDVHTISIKRLDYDIQHESIAEKRHVKKMEQQIKSRYDYMKLVLIALPLLLILLIILSFLFGNRMTEKEKKLLEDAASFERFAADRSMELQVILTEGEALLKKVTPIQNTAEQYFAAKIRSIMLERSQEALEASVSRLETEKDAALSDLAALRQENADLKTALASAKETSQPSTGQQQPEPSAESETDQASGEPAGVSGSSSSPSSPQQNSDTDPQQLALLNEEILTLKKELKTQSAAAESFRRKYEAVSPLLLKIRKDDIRAQILEFREQRRFNDIDVMLTMESIRSPELKDWIRKCETENARISRIDTAVTGSGTKYALTSFGSGAKIVVISGGYIDYQEDGKIHQKPWTQFSTDTLWQILSAKNSMSPGEEKEVKSALELLKGNPGNALKLQPANTELYEQVRLLRENTIRRIRYALPGDRKRAEIMAQTLLRQLEGAPEYEKWKAELIQLFNTSKSDSR